VKTIIRSNSRPLPGAQKYFAVLFTAVACITSAYADPVTLTFNLPDLVPNVPVEIDGYYSGGTDALGAVGPNYGIGFQPSTGTNGTGGTTGGGAALIDTINPPPPSGGNVLAFPIPAGGSELAILTDAAGTTYVSYDFLNPVVAGTGGDLGYAFGSSATITPLGSSGWSHADVTFSQPQEVFIFQLFGGANPDANEIANLTMNALPVAPAPETSPLVLIGGVISSAAGLGFLRRRRQKASCA
jgi:hypothetical protein